MHSNKLVGYTGTRCFAYIDLRSKLLFSCYIPATETQILLTDPRVPRVHTLTSACRTCASGSVGIPLQGRLNVENIYDKGMARTSPFVWSQS